MNTTKAAIYSFLTGLGVTLGITLGAALVNLGPTESLEAWGRNLLFSESAACGAFLVNWLRTRSV